MPPRLASPLPSLLSGRNGDEESGAISSPRILNPALAAVAVSGGPAAWWRALTGSQKLSLSGVSLLLMLLVVLVSHEAAQCSDGSARPAPVGARVGPGRVTVQRHDSSGTSLEQIVQSVLPKPGAPEESEPEKQPEPEPEPKSAPATLPLPASGVSLEPPLPAVTHPAPSRPMKSATTDPNGKAVKALEARESQTGAHCRSRYPHLKGTLPVPRWRENVLIALNLHNTGHLVSFLQQELLRLAHVLAQARPEGEKPSASNVDPSNVYISIYESGSGDNTGEQLRNFAHELQIHNIPHTIVTGGPIGRDEHHRINGYARIRNAALAPMYDAIRQHRASGGSDGWLVDRVIFINDVFWCAEDVLRLLDVGDGGDEDLPQPSVAEVRAAALAQSKALQLPPTTKLAVGVDGTVSPPPQQRAPGSRPHMVCGMDYERSGGPGGIMFYDHWVQLDRAGRKVMGRQYPFFHDEFDRAAYREARRMDVVACWGGIVAIDGSVFSEDGLTLRARTEHCGASECSHISVDIIAARPRSAWIQQDNMVATSYNDGVREELPKIGWFDVGARLQNRHRARERRNQGKLGGCKQLVDSNRDIVSHEDAPDESCPALPYPLTVYQGQPIAYPPPTWCCGDYLQGPYYWMNCHPVVTQVFTQAQKEKLKNSDFNPFVDLHTYTNVPFEWN
jgi:hypothetical protein